jgi:hypothetical protein
MLSGYFWKMTACSSTDWTQSSKDETEIEKENNEGNHPTEAASNVGQGHVPDWYHIMLSIANNAHKGWEWEL